MVPGGDGTGSQDGPEGGTGRVVGRERQAGSIVGRRRPGTRAQGETAKGIGRSLLCDVRAGGGEGSGVDRVWWVVR